MLPRAHSLAASVSSETFRTWPRVLSGPNEPPEPLDLLRCRITDTRHVRFQLRDNTPIRLVVPSFHQVLATLFAGAGFQGVQDSSHAQYQNAFIKRCGSLLEATHILKTSPYRGFLTLLANLKQNAALLGRVLKEPKRRALFQSELYQAFNQPVASATADYLKSAETLPAEAAKLIKLQLLERGFELNCSSCSATVWYRAEEVGQTFRCQRCYDEQTLQTNSLWLYKLPEVVFQLFFNDADVPLLALLHFLTRSTKNFQYVLDSDVQIGSADKSVRNIDFGCLSDGRVYVGEAKRNNVIDAHQFRFYEDLVMQSTIDGVVFATTAANWSAATMARVEALKAKFKGEVITLTEAQLLEK
jgi:hypothetical protein